MKLQAAVVFTVVVGASARESSSAATPTAVGDVFQATTQTSYSYTLAATNPTAIPLASLGSNAPRLPTHPLPSTFAPGSIPTAVSGAPPLPNAAALNPASYPPLDVVVPVDSPEVKRWVQEVAKSGVPIPNIAPTVPGGCPANPAAAVDKSRCWWTCDGCAGAADVTTCPDKLTLGLSYDDGPDTYTPDLLRYMHEKNIKSTFFVVGSRIISYPAMLQTEYMEGHQIAVHTWSHFPLTTLTNEQIIGELGWSKKVIKDVLGVTPTQFRPPFGDIDNRVRAIAKAMDLEAVIWTRLSPVATFDTDDFDLHSGHTTPSHVLYNWNFIERNAAVINTGFIPLEHDLFPQSVGIAVGYILPDALAHQPPFSIQPIINCLKRPLGYAYAETRGRVNATALDAPPVAAAVLNTPSGADGDPAPQSSAGSSGPSVSSPSVAAFISALLFVGLVAQTPEARP
ncbi:hypothetical protein C8J57DRAFT_1447010 [Mycena rebaudengoi]|nr:hypothetical protein C8J57DRAFT_1447010 [Mycena rebaudengoi]